MPGVFRPSSLADVINVIQQQAIGDTGTSVSGVGYFAEAAEAVTLAESVTVTVQPLPAWGAGTWGGLSWS